MLLLCFILLWPLWLFLLCCGLNVSAHISNAEENARRNR